MTRATTPLKVLGLCKTFNIRNDWGKCRCDPTDLSLGMGHPWPMHADPRSVPHRTGDNAWGGTGRRDASMCRVRSTCDMDAALSTVRGACVCGLPYAQASRGPERSQYKPDIIAGMISNRRIQEFFGVSS